MKLNRNLIFGILFWGICSSCNKAEQGASSPKLLVPDNLIQQLNQAKNSQLDSAIYYANLILDYIRENNLQDSLYIRYNSIKADQLSKTTDHDQEALRCLVENYVLARNLDDSLTQAKTALALGNYYDFMSQYTLALPYIQEAANYYIKNTHQPEAPKLLSNLGEMYLNSGSLYEALENFNVASAIYEFQKDTIQLAANLANIGYTMVQLELFEAAVENTRRGITLLESLTNGKDVGPTLGNLSINYRYIYPDSSIYYQKKAIELTKALGDSVNWIASVYNLGNSLRAIGRFDEAEKSYQQVYQFSERNKLEQGLVLSCNALGSLYAKTGKPAKAIPYATLADLALKKTGSPFHIAINLQTLISAHTQLNELQQASKFQIELDSLQNQMQLLQTQSTINYIEQSMKAERTAFDNQLLQQKNKAIVTTIRWRTYSIFFLLLAMAISAVFWLRWKSDNQSAQQAIQVLLKRYRKDIQQKKLSEQSSAEDSSYPQLAQKLRYLLEAEKIHLQPNLKIEDVLQSLQISYKDLNQLLKSEFQTTFPQLINQYRVKEAQRLLSLTDNSNLSLDKVATLSGFGTRQSFYKIFQAQTGVSPGTFRTYFSTQA